MATPLWLCKRDSQLVFIPFQLHVSCSYLFCLAEPLGICGESFHFTWKQWWQSCPYEWRMIWHVMQLIWTGIRRTMLSFNGKSPWSIDCCPAGSWFCSFILCLFFIIVETECVSTSSFSWCHALRYFLWQTVFPPLPPPRPLIIIYAQLFPPIFSSFFTSWPTFSFALPPSSFFFSVTNPSDVLRVPACSVRTHTYTHLCSVSALLS